MRLTHVTHLRLPFGPLHSYQVTVTPTGDLLPISFDQRIHVSQGDRPGSWMALSLRLAEPVDRAELASAWLDVIKRHGTLNSVFHRDNSGELRLEKVDIGSGNWVEHVAQSGQSMRDLFREVLDTQCRSFASPSYRLCIVETAARPTVIIASDHAHVDMWSMLVMARDLLTALAAQDPDIDVVPAFATHTEQLSRRQTVPAELQRRWQEILDAGDGFMPKFPLPLGEPKQHPERVEVRDVFNVDDTATFAAHARSLGVSTLSLTTALMAEVTKELADAPLRALFPVHSRFDKSWHDSVGWFITNSVLDVSGTDPQSAADAVKEAIWLGSSPLEQVLAPWGGMPTTPGMFAISWLDLRRLPVSIDDVGLEAQYISAALRTDGVMLWFILDDTGAHLRCRYPDTLEARKNVGNWLNVLVERMRRTARESAGSQLAIGSCVVKVQRATRRDIPRLVSLLIDEPPSDLTPYYAAFDAITINDAYFLATVRSESGEIIGTMQLSIVPGLSDTAHSRIQIQGLQVADIVEADELILGMLNWAHAHGRARGAGFAEVMSENSALVQQCYGLGYIRNGTSLRIPLS